MILWGLYCKLFVVVFFSLMYMKYFIIAFCGDVVSYLYYCVMQRCTIFPYGSLDECIEYYWNVCGVYALCVLVFNCIALYESWNVPSLHTLKWSQVPYI